MMMDWTIEEGGLDRADVQELLAQHVAEMNAGSPPSACHVLAANAQGSGDPLLYGAR